MTIARRGGNFPKRDRQEGNQRCRKEYKGSEGAAMKRDRRRYDRRRPTVEACRRDLWQLRRICGRRMTNSKPVQFKVVERVHSSKRVTGSAGGVEGYGCS